MSDSNEGNRSNYTIVHWEHGKEASKASQQTTSHFFAADTSIMERTSKRKKLTVILLSFSTCMVVVFVGLLGFYAHQKGILGAQATAQAASVEQAPAVPLEQAYTNYITERYSKSE